MASKKNQDIRALSDEELLQEIEATEQEYQKLKFDNAVKGLDKAHIINDTRRDIARMKTEARSRELAAATPEALANRSRIRERRRKK